MSALPGRGAPGLLARLAGLRRSRHRDRRAERARVATISGPRLAKLDLSKLDVARAIRAADEAAFNQAALDALKAFKALWGTGKNKSHPDSYHDWLGTALAIDGESRGLTYAVESDYTPRWLIDGPPAGLLEHFKTLYEVTGES
ncbi:MAG: immunity 49 family protein [Polyangiaceae bacterium]|nr:immunity 49 family protein [Polyangiaceae bacterium]